MLHHIFFVAAIVLTVSSTPVEQPSDVDVQFLEARDIIYYSGFCGVDLRDSIGNVQSQCNENGLRFVVNNGVPTTIYNANGQGKPDSDSGVQCDHYLELQVVNSVAMVPVDTGPWPSNEACSAINAMLDTMDGKFPDRESYSEIKTDYLKASPLFTSTNGNPNTVWVDTNVNQLKGQMIRRYLTVGTDYAPGEIGDAATLAAVQAYMQWTVAQTNAVQLADELDDQWQPLIDAYDTKIQKLVGDEWPPNGNERNLYDKKIAQLTAGKNKLMSDAASIVSRWGAIVAWIGRQPP